ncbi:hypothetical protein L3Q82_006118 [Xyrichtys novacula]|nr:hypothetical protein L3Q82_006118 [Xyrichtys novacula]
MDRKMLLLVCLQVFLLISTFTSTDAAALGTNRQQSQQLPQFLSNCWRRPGACSSFGKGPTDELKATPSPVELEEFLSVIQIPKVAFSAEDEDLLFT